MNHYMEIRLLPDPEFVTQILMSALFAKLHRRLVDMGSGTVGISFPDIELEPPCSLGERLRLHSNEQQLTILMNMRWMEGMHDHTETSGFLTVPNVAKFRTFFRVQAKSSPERLRRRRIKRHGVSEGVAFEATLEHVSERLNLPYLFLSSRSNQQRFPIFINAGEPVSTAVAGTFGTYGLSRTTTVPWF